MNNNCPETCINKIIKFKIDTIDGKETCCIVSDDHKKWITMLNNREYINISDIVALTNIGFIFKLIE
jgi:hypothetical protein